ncbi:MAG: zinc ABC transporter substrate-binding protein [Prolixibacteraceae bacterium]|nr:zinc ABC transporter substrate-binding protein [Prolixibacteraceae bacterium]
MKKLIFLFLIIISVSSCNSTKKSSTGEGSVITVSIVPQKTFVEKIAGDDFKINVLVPPGTTPEAGNLLPSQLKEIANSELWFRIGHIGFEYSWKEKIEQANREMKVVDLSEGLDLIEEGHTHGDEHVHESGIDPHIWLSPRLVKEISKKIYDELVLLKPEKTVEYKTNYLNFVKEIDELDIEIANKLREYKNRKIIVFHPSLSYFARDYGLDQWALESGGKEPAPQHMAKVVDMAKKEHINVIYIQDEFDQENARVFAEEIDGKVIQISPLDPSWVDNLRYITNVFVENF